MEVVVGPQSKSGCSSKEKNSSTLAENWILVIQPISSHFTDSDNLAHRTDEVTCKVVTFMKTSISINNTFWLNWKTWEFSWHVFNMSNLLTCDICSYFLIPETECMNKISHVHILFCTTWFCSVTCSLTFPTQFIKLCIHIGKPLFITKQKRHTYKGVSRCFQTES